MDFRNINIDKLSLKKNVKNYIIYYDNAKYLEFYTLNLRCPFGLEEKYNDYFINFHCDSDDFKNLILSIESKLEELINNNKNSTYVINSQINKNSNMLYTKLIKKNDKIIINYRNIEDNQLNIYKLEKNKYYFIKILIDNLFIKNNKIFYKIKIKDLILT